MTPLRNIFGYCVNEVPTTKIISLQVVKIDGAVNEGNLHVILSAVSKNVELLNGGVPITLNSNAKIVTG